MNRADRRHLQRTARQALKGKTGQLQHPVPESVTLIGGPMNSWVVKPDAPALRPDWHAGLIEASAAGLLPPGAWAAMTEEQREPYRVKARAMHPPGRYMQRAGNRADWHELP